jgi:hypothetical protein
MNTIPLVRLNCRQSNYDVIESMIANLSQLRIELKFIYTVESSCEAMYQRVLRLESLLLRLKNPIRNVYQWQQILDQLNQEIKLYN